ncbi:MAG TPA: molecular chaperone HtpG, partial [Bacillota bacterium]|nr:molecular chaperone HtpG [Bacillota bacterium]
AIQMLHTYQEKEIKSVSSGDLGIEVEENKDTAESAAKDNQPLFDRMKEILSDKVKAVRPSKRLKNHPVCLSNEGELSIEMEKVLSAMPNNPNLKAEKVLEINPNHQVFQSLQEASQNDPEKLKLYTDLLYNQALLIEGLPIEDPVEFTNNMCKLMK